MARRMPDFITARAISGPWGDRRPIARHRAVVLPRRRGPTVRPASRPHPARIPAAPRHMSAARDSLGAEERGTGRGVRGGGWLDVLDDAVPMHMKSDAAKSVIMCDVLWRIQKGGLERCGELSLKKLLRNEKKTSSGFDSSCTVARLKANFS